MRSVERVALTAAAASLTEATSDLTTVMNNGQVEGPLLVGPLIALNRARSQLGIISAAGDSRLVQVEQQLNLASKPLLALAINPHPATTDEVRGVKEALADLEAALIQLRAAQRPLRSAQQSGGRGSALLGPPLTP